MKNFRLVRAGLSVCLFFLSAYSWSQVQKIYLNPKATGIAKQTDYIDSIRFIVLDVKKEPDAFSNSAVQVTGTYFLLTNYTEKKLIVFSRTGQYLKTISYKKLAGNFSPVYVSLTNQVVFFGYNKNYTLTAKDRIKITLEWNHPRNRKYFKKYVINLDSPDLAIQKTTPTQYDVIRASPLYGDYYSSGGVNTSELYKDSLDYELKIFKDNRLVRGFFPYNRVNEPRFLYYEGSSSVTRTDTSDIKLVTRPYYDTVYKLVNMNMVPVYKIVLPAENSIPASFYTVPFQSRTERENFNRNNGWVLNQIHSFYETPRFIMLDMSYLSNFGTYLYDKKTRATYTTRNVKPDKSQYNLQLITQLGKTRDGNRFYKLIKAEELISFFEANKDVPVPVEIQEFLKSNPGKQTPLIVEFTCKD